MNFTEHFHAAVAPAVFLSAEHALTDGELNTLIEIKLHVKTLFEFHSVGIIMLTPRFDLTQDDEQLIISIYARYANIRDTEVYVEATDFRFHSAPYYLR